MLKKIDSKAMGRSEREWLASLHHFSFGDYYNLDNLDFGVLRVINDDLIEAGYGFPMHSHRNIEIVTYIIDGELTHEDSMGNKRTLGRGEVQFMTAGTGVAHSEYNFGTKTLRLLQIWIMTDRKGHEPAYGDYSFAAAGRQGKWQHLVSRTGGAAPVQIHQDVNFYVAEIAAGKVLDFSVEAERQAYLVLIEGGAKVNGEILDARDALESRIEHLEIVAVKDSHFLVIEMPDNHDWQLGQKLKDEEN
jgi:hypothetical protein